MDVKYYNVLCSKCLNVLYGRLKGIWIRHAGGFKYSIVRAMKSNLIMGCIFTLYWIWLVNQKHNGKLQHKSKSNIEPSKCVFIYVKILLHFFYLNKLDVLYIIIIIIIKKGFVQYCLSHLDTLETVFTISRTLRKFIYSRYAFSWLDSHSFTKWK